LFWITSGTHIAADSPSLWNQCYELLMDVVCSTVHFVSRGRGERETIWGGRLAAVEALCPATTTAMHFILQNLLHRDRSDLTKALQDYCTFYLGHFLYPKSRPHNRRRRSAALHQNERMESYYICAYHDIVILPCMSFCTLQPHFIAHISLLQQLPFVYLA
jgi:hypothetical protein